MDAARCAAGLGLELRLNGRTHRGSRVLGKGMAARPPDPNGWLNGVGLVVQPAFIEDKPRKLLQALASGMKVVATPACGLAPQENLVLVPEGDVEALRSAIQQHLC